MPSKIGVSARSVVAEGGSDADWAEDDVGVGDSRVDDGEVVGGLKEPVSVVPAMN